jgi:hypothetical protein
MIGTLYWDGEGFGNSSEDVRFSLEGDGSVPVLRASVRDNDGNMHERDLNLSERLGNNDGNFVYSKMLLP